mmetsp:Transcript_45934/g.137262  ORF Transcript_45934/g.137262 Transcript_45934/m.137262 type:complete len:214 (-) Transcript_45934:31-672(-)
MPPATRAKRAAVEAPKLKPPRSCNASRSPVVMRNTRKVRLRPPRPKATTMNPMTEPAVKATCRPLFRVPMAQATVVLTFASVATNMPAQPARALSEAPAAKEIATSTPSPPPATGWRVNRMQSTTARKATNPAICLYSSCRKAMAPDRIWPASSSSFATPRRLPVGCRRSRRQSARTNRRQAVAAPSPGTAIASWGNVWRPPLSIAGGRPRLG